MGRICDGYGVWGGGGALDYNSNGHAETAASNAVSSPVSDLRRGPTSTPGLCVTSEQQVYLEWFLHGTTIKPPRIFNSRYWDPAILQATVHEPMILQGLLALSAAHQRHTMDPASRGRDNLAPDALEIFLLKHYSKAIKGLQAYLEGGEKSLKPNWFVAATMCTIFVLLELMRGRFEAARMHVVKGAYIVQHFMKQPEDTESNYKIVQFFLRLQHQTALFLRQLHSPQTLLSLSTAPAPEFRFPSPTEAQYLLDEFVEQIAYLAEQKRQLVNATKASRMVFDEVCGFLLVGLESWSQTCEATLAEGRMKMESSDLAAYETLLRRHQMAKSAAKRFVDPRFGLGRRRTSSVGSVPGLESEVAGTKDPAVIVSLQLFPGLG